MRNTKRALLVVGAVLLAGLAAGQARSGWLAAAGVPAAPKADGIRVHGDWKLVVRTRAGRVVSVRRFHNDLTLNGAGQLSDLLDGQTAAEPWAVALGTAAGPTMTGPCPQQSGNGNPFGVGATTVPRPCVVYENGGGLVVTSPSSGPDANKLVLSGYRAVGANGTINRVATVMDTAVAGNAVPESLRATFAAMAAKQFTARTLSSGVSVTAGQIVQVTVKISFS
jgi:hypothetical protein